MLRCRVIESKTPLSLSDVRIPLRDIWVVGGMAMQRPISRGMVYFCRWNSPGQSLNIDTTFPGHFGCSSATLSSRQTQRARAGSLTSRSALSARLATRRSLGASQSLSALREPHWGAAGTVGTAAVAAAVASCTPRCVSCVGARVCSLREHSFSAQHRQKRP